MSLTIKLYTNTSPRNYVSKDVTQVGTDLAGVLRAETSIINPGIRVELSSVPANVNYMYVQDWGRYYFIEDIISVRTDLWELRGTADPLYSFRDQIKACTGIIHRSESNYNVYLDDGAFRTYAQPKIVTLSFPSGFSTWEYLLAVAGGSSSSREVDNSVENVDNVTR